MDFRDFNEFVKDTSKYIIVIILVFLFVNYVASFHQVLGPSMNPTYIESDVLLINKIKYKFSSVKRGDVIIVKVDGKYMIKRVLALPNETIKCVGGKTYINNQVINDNYSSITKDFNEVRVNDDSYFVLGDNRPNSEDSRGYGAISKEDIVGQVFIKLWPIK